MNDLFQLACLIGVAALPLVVLGVRAARPKFVPWWAVFLLVIGVCSHPTLSPSCNSPCLNTRCIGLAMKSGGVVRARSRAS